MCTEYTRSYFVLCSCSLAFLKPNLHIVFFNSNLLYLSRCKRRRLLLYLITHTHAVGLPWVSAQPVSEAVTYTSHNKYKRKATMPPAGCEPPIPAIERPQTYRLGARPPNSTTCIKSPRIGSTRGLKFFHFKSRLDDE